MSWGLNLPMAALVVSLLAAPAFAQVQPTPDGWRPEQAAAKTDAFIAEQLALFANPPAGENRYIILSRVRMLRPDDPTVLREFQEGPERGEPSAWLAEAARLTRVSDVPSRIRAVYLADQALRADPTSVQARLMRARALTNLNMGQLSALAWDDATRVLAADPTLHRAHLVRAILLLRVNRLNESLTEQNAAIALAPREPAYRALRGETLLALGRYQPAIDDLTLALSVTPNDPAVLRFRAGAYFKDKRPALALADLEALERLMPQSVEVQAHLIEVLDAMGRKADADARHLAVIVRDEAGARKNRYLAQRTSPALEKAAAEKRARDAFQSFVDDFAPAEYSYEGLVERMQSAGEARDPEKERRILLGMADDVDRHAKAAFRKGSALSKSPDFQYLDPELSLKLVEYMTVLARIQDGMSRIGPALRSND
ncbi:hypothetical protein GVN21_19835 [Caulobacter sp. SLTY]|uniref:hypothetical protein n=1 Tax=Caulobacter sp. SLTY TaxID=2683262 RepID=UPI001412F82A|nr:hypothetical protein [Caulobacter sp. SLTY]NBB17618.1 hypothetical protein [Caulobacter sp. SLTY]